jgi:hypothetical protein
MRDSDAKFLLVLVLSAAAIAVALFAAVNAARVVLRPQGATSSFNAGRR